MTILLFLLAISLIMWVLKAFPPNKTEEDNSVIWDTSEEVIPESEEAQSITLKSPSFDVSKIKEYTGEGIKQFEFRPQKWEQFVSQDKAKEQAQTIIKKIARGIRGHLFLSARQGMGKTAFIQLLAKEIKAKLIIRVGKQLDDPEELVNVINEINTSEKENVIFFLDEMDSMDKKTIKMLNPIIEQFEVAGKQIKPFIFAGASISKDILIKNNPDTLDRIPHHIHFTSYSSKDIKTILTQYKNQLYFNDKVSEEVLILLSNSCKFCPRIAISLLEDFIVELDIQKVLKNRSIVKNGITEIDIKILEVLNEATRPMGANAVALRAGLTQRQYTQEFEPFLYEFKYIDRSPSRTISKKGKELLKEV